MSVRPVEVTVMDSAGLNICDATLGLLLMSFESLIAGLSASTHTDVA